MLTTFSFGFIKFIFFISESKSGEPLASLVTSTLTPCVYPYVTGFTKRGLPHTSNSMNLEGHTFVFKKRTNLKFSLAILTTDQISGQ